MTEKRDKPSPFRAGKDVVACGHTAHADVNAANNILAAGHAVLACGGEISPHQRLGVGAAAPVKQEPIEATLPAAAGRAR